MPHHCGTLLFLYDIHSLLIIIFITYNYHIIPLYRVIHTIIKVPFFGDQPFWGACVAQQGVGPTPIPYKKLTADKLKEAILFCVK